jgi:hypothetical protein
MTTVSHGPYDQAAPADKPTTVTALVAESHGSIGELHRSLDNLTELLKVILGVEPNEGGPDDETMPIVSPMRFELLKLNDGIDSATRRVNMLMARLEL